MTSSDAGGESLKERVLPWWFHRNTKAKMALLLVQIVACALAAWGTHHAIHQTQADSSRGTFEASARGVGRTIDRAINLVSGVFGIYGTVMATLPMPNAEVYAEVRRCSHWYLGGGTASQQQLSASCHRVPCAPRKWACGLPYSFCLR